MYAVIFKAEIKKIDPVYQRMAARLRALAISDYGCLEFTSCREGQYEIAISYWPNKAAIKAWQANPEHQQAQALGQSQWYQSYQVQVVEVLREYDHNGVD